MVGQLGDRGSERKKGAETYAISYGFLELSY